MGKFTRRSYSAKKKTSFRRKKIYRKKRVLKKKKYNKGHWVTLEVTKPMSKGTYTQGDTDFQNRFSVYWGLHAGGGVANQITLGDSQEWDFWRQVFGKYKVQGVKMTWHPERIRGGGD